MTYIYFLKYKIEKKKKLEGGIFFQSPNQYIFSIRKLHSIPKNKSFLLYKIKKKYIKYYHHYHYIYF